jgi:hypothetical protein
MAGDEGKLEIVPERTVEVREMRKVFRLTHNDLGRPQVAIVAADTEDEARQIAFIKAFSGGIGAIRNLLSPKTGKRWKHTSSAIFCFEPLVVERRTCVAMR